MSPTTADNSKKRRRASRLGRIAGVALLTLAIVATGMFLTQGWWLRSLVHPAVRSATGLDMKSDSVRLTWRGGVRATGLVLQSATAPTNAPPIVEAKHVVASFRLRELIQGNLELDSFTLIEPVVRVSAQDAAATTNDEAWEQARLGFRAFEALPEVEVIDGTLEFIDPDRDDDQVLLAVSGGGSIQRRRGDEAVYDIHLRQTGEGDAIVVEGWVDLTNRSAHLEGGELDLSNWFESFAIANDAESWRSIVEGGRLTTAQIDYTPEEGLVSSMDIADVRLSMPLPRDVNGEDRMTLDDVSGRVSLTSDTIVAQVWGVVDGLPTSATLETDGLSLTSPFRCSFIGGPFVVDQSWKPLALAPGDVQSILRDFSGPSAEVQARVDLRREAPSVSPGTGIDVSGEIHLQHGAAMFVEFPYPIRDITGVVRFDDEQIRFEELQGVGPTGAKLTGEGVVDPDPAGVGLELRIHGERAPIDHVLLDALPTDERAIVESLFDTSMASRLAAAGVFATPQQKAEAEAAVRRMRTDLEAAEAAGELTRVSSLRAAIADARTVASRPTFELGGFADVDILVTREAEPNPMPRPIVNATIQNAGILYSRFPYPVYVSPLRIHIDGDSVDVVNAPIQGLSGATGHISGAVMYGAGETRPDLSIQFSSMPVDELLLSSVNLVTEHDVGDASRPMGAGARTQLPPESVGGVLQRLGAQGAISGIASITGNEHDGVQWAVDTALSGMRLEVGDPATALVVDEFAGSLIVDVNGWSVRDGAASLAGSPVRFDITSPPEPDGSTTVTFHAPAIDAAAPMESLVEVLDPQSAESLKTVRGLAQLNGPISISGDVSFGDGIESRRIVVAGDQELELITDGRLSRLKPRDGQVVISDDQIVFESVSMELLDHLGASSGVVEIDGLLDAALCGELVVDADNLAIETPLAREAIRSMHPNLAKWFDAAEPAGRLDASATLVRAPGESWQAVSGRAEPRSLRFLAGSERVAFDQISGALTLDRDGGRVDGLRAQAATWSIEADGAWFSGGTPGVQLVMSAKGARLSDDILALLPNDVREVFESLEIRVDGGFELRDGAIEVNAPVQGADLGDGFRDGIRFEGIVHCAGAYLNAGMPFSDIDGDIAIRAERPPYADATMVDVSLQIHRLRAAGLTMSELTATIESAPKERDTLLVQVMGESHGGRIWGEGSIHTIADSPVSRGGYEFDLRLSGLDLATALKEFAPPDSVPSHEDVTGERGFVDASLVLAGDLREGALPRGAGEIRILGGELARLPLVMTILQLGNIVAPEGERLDYASAEYSLANGVADFNRLLAVSPSMALIGDGSMTLPDFDLDLRFGASGNYRLPVFSAVLDVLRNELLTTRVQGTLANPEFSAVQLSGTRRLLSSIFGPGDGDGDDETESPREPAIATVPESPD